MNMTSYQTRLGRAESEFTNGTFMSQAAKQRACSNLNFALEMVVGEITSLILDNAGHANTVGNPLHDLYWELCGVSCLNFTKKSKMVEELLGEESSQWMALGEQCVAIYATYKAAAITKAPPKVSLEVQLVEAKVQKSIITMMEERKAKYDRCLRLDSLFGTMGITANVHVVHGHKGAVFLRSFYYVLGVLTPLQVIIAAMQESDRQKLLA